VWKKNQNFFRSKIFFVIFATDKMPNAMTIYEKIKKIKSIVSQHKILVAVVVYVVWVAFFDQYSWLLQWKIKQSIDALSAEKQYYIDKIHNDSAMNSELQTNDNNLEKFAREHYFMKASDEDVFEIVEQ